MKVVEIPAGNLRDIVGMIRRCAAEMEAGTLPMPTSVVMVATDADGETECYCFGEAETRVKAVGLLHFGILELGINR